MHLTACTLLVIGDVKHAAMNLTICTRLAKGDVIDMYGVMHLTACTLIAGDVKILASPVPQGKKSLSRDKAVSCFSWLLPVQIALTLPG